MRRQRLFAECSTETPEDDLPVRSGSDCKAPVWAGIGGVRQALARPRHGCHAIGKRRLAHRILCLCGVVALKRFARECEREARIGVGYRARLCCEILRCRDCACASGKQRGDSDDDACQDHDRDGAHRELGAAPPRDTLTLAGRLADREELAFELVERWLPVIAPLDGFGESRAAQ